MIYSKTAGIIFSNTNDKALKEFTANRSMASLPFAGRYRLIDFIISNYVNAGIQNVGVITNRNYNSLLDHLGSGLFWDLDRKNGGLSIVPPFISGQSKNDEELDCFARASEYIKHHNCEYVVASESGFVANVDIKELVKFHVDSESDITIVYRNADSPDKFDRTLKLKVNSDQKVTSVTAATGSKTGGKLSMGLFVFTRSAFNNFISTAFAMTDGSFVNAITQKSGNYKISGFEHKGFVGVIDSKKAYFETSMRLLEKDVRDELFNKERPIYTKTKDDMPTRYGLHSSVSNSLIADGCIVDGTVKNSILFRGVRVKKGAVIDNCILMQGVEVRENSKLKYVASDKNAVIGGKDPISGTNRKAFIVKKNQVLTD